MSDSYIALVEKSIDERTQQYQELLQLRAENEKLRLENDKLREALKPLAAMDVELLDENKKPTGIHAFDKWDQNRVVFDMGKDRKIVVADLRRARALLNGEN